MKIATRIIKVTAPDNHVSYRLEYEHTNFFGKKRWKRVKKYEGDGVWDERRYSTEVDALNDICWYDGTQYKEEIYIENLK